MCHRITERNSIEFRKTAVQQSACDFPRFSESMKRLHKSERDRWRFCTGPNADVFVQKRARVLGFKCGEGVLGAVQLCQNKVTDGVSTQ